MRESQVGGKSERWATHEYQCSIEVLVVPLDVVRIVLCRLPLVHGVEIESKIISLDGLERELGSYVRSAVSDESDVAYRTYHFGSIFSGGDSFSLFSPFSASSMGYACPGALGEWKYGVGQAGRGGPRVVHFRALELRDLTVVRAWVSRKPDYRRRNHKKGC